MRFDCGSWLALRRASALAMACASSAGCATIFNSGASVTIARSQPILAVSDNGIVRAGALHTVGERAMSAQDAQRTIESAPRVVQVQPRRCAATTLDVRTTQSSERVQVQSRVGWGWFVLNVFLTVGIGAIVDAATGAWCYYEIEE